MYAERPVVVDRKCFPFGAADVLEWRRRMLEVSGMPEDTSLDDVDIHALAKSYRRQPPRRIEAIGRKYGAGYFAVEGGRDYPFARLYRFKKWSIYRLPPRERRRRVVFSCPSPTTTQVPPALLSRTTSSRPCSMASSSRSPKVE